MFDKIYNFDYPKLKYPWKTTVICQCGHRRMWVAIWILNLYSCPPIPLLQTFTFILQHFSPSETFPLSLHHLFLTFEQLNEDTMDIHLTFNSWPSFIQIKFSSSLNVFVDTKSKSLCRARVPWCYNMFYGGNNLDMFYGVTS